jgi:hypothetical protein
MLKDEPRLEKSVFRMIKYIFRAAIVMMGSSIGRCLLGSEIEPIGELQVTSIYSGLLFHSDESGGIN